MSSLSPLATPAPVLLAPSVALLRGFELAAQPAPAPLNPALGASALFAGLQARQGFRIGSLNLMIPFADGSELTEMPQVYRLPHAPHWLLGMANLHGALVPVFDLARWLGIERTGGAKPMLLVLAQGANAAGVVIDGLPQRLRWSSEHLAQDNLVPESLAEVAPRAVLIGESLWFDLECTALLQSLERALAPLH